MAGSAEDFLITDIKGYTPQISRLISMMNYTRNVTVSSVQNLTQPQLDFLLDENANTIGALLMHMASVDLYYRIFTFEKRELTIDEEAKWLPALDLGQSARDSIKGHDVEYYLDILNETRNKTLEMFRSVNDNWLYEEQPLWNNKPGNNYFMWFHVFEDEINHRGQINLIRKRAF